MANLNNVPKEVLLLLLEVSEEGDDGEPILGKQDYLQLSYVSRTLYNALKTLIWHQLVFMLTEVEESEAADTNQVQNQGVTDIHYQCDVSHNSVGQEATGLSISLETYSLSLSPSST